MHLENALCCRISLLIRVVYSRNMQVERKVLFVHLLMSLIETALTGTLLNISKTNWELEIVLAHEDCNKFYKYLSDKWLEIVCPMGLYFDKNHWHCDWKHNVNCSGRKVPEELRDTDDEIFNYAETDNEDIDDDETDLDGEQEKVINTNLGYFDNGCPINPLINWLLPNDMDCNQFYYCFWGIKVKRRCPPFFHFNRRYQVRLINDGGRRQLSF